MRRTIWFGKKIQDKLILDEKELFGEYIKSIPNEATFQMIFEDIPKPKSKKQLGAFWGLWMVELIRGCEELGIDSSYIFNLPHPTGTPVTAVQLKEYFYVLFPTHNDKGKQITMSSKDWTSKHQNTFTENIRNFVASTWGIVLSEPNPDYKFER